MNTIGHIDPQIATAAHYQSPSCTDWADRTWENLTVFIGRIQPLLRPIYMLANTVTTIAGTIFTKSSDYLNRINIFSVVMIPFYISNISHEAQSDKPLVVKGPTIIGQLKNLFYTGKTVSKIAADIWNSTKKVFEIAAKTFEHLSLVAVLLVPFHIYNIVQAVQSDHPFYKKALEIITEVGGMFVVAVSIIQWTASNVLSEVGAVLPYLLGVSLIFQAIDIYKKVKELNKTQEAVGKIDDLYQKILADNLQKEDEEILENAFQINKDHLKEFCDNVKLNEEQTVKDHLALRVSRTLISNKVALTATIIETIASVVLLVGTLLAPELSIAFTIANASLIGCSSILKIAAFFHDYKTESLPLLQAS